MTGGVFNFGIDGYQPHWLHRRSEVLAEHGAQLRGLVGRVLTRSWLVWDLDEDSWFANGPVLLDFQGQQVEINHQKFYDLSITWNSVNPDRPVLWPTTDGFRLAWRDHAPSELVALRGQRVRAVDLFEWTPVNAADLAGGSLAVGFTLGEVEVMVFNALDENGLGFGPPNAQYHRHPIG